MGQLEVYRTAGEHDEREGSVAGVESVDAADIYRIMQTAAAPETGAPLGAKLKLTKALPHVALERERRQYCRVVIVSAGVPMRPVPLWR